MYIHFFLANQIQSFPDRIHNPREYIWKFNFYNINPKSVPGVQVDVIRAKMCIVQPMVTKGHAKLEGPQRSWYLYQMVTQNMLRTYEGK